MVQCLQGWALRMLAYRWTNFAPLALALALGTVLAVREPAPRLPFRPEPTPCTP